MEMSGLYEASKFNPAEVAKACHTALQPVLREAGLTVSPYTTSFLNSKFGNLEIRKFGNLEIRKSTGIDGGQPYKNFSIPITVSPGRGKHF